MKPPLFSRKRAAKIGRATSRAGQRANVPCPGNRPRISRIAYSATSMVPESTRLDQVRSSASSRSGPIEAVTSTITREKDMATKVFVLQHVHPLSEGGEDVK